MNKRIAGGLAARAVFGGERGDFERGADMEDELVRNADECGENCLECLKCVGAEKVQDGEREAGA